MNKNMLKLWVIGLTVSIFLIIGTFLIMNCSWDSGHKDNSESTETTRNVTSISVQTPLNLSQVVVINYTEFSSIITNMSENLTIIYYNGTEMNMTIEYGIRNDSTNNTICFYIYLSNRSTIFDCTISSDKTNTAFLSATLYGSSYLSQKDIEDEKEVTKCYVEKVIYAAKLSIDWSKAEWSVSYATS